MKLFSTMWPDPSLSNTPVSPKIQSSFPLGRGTLRPSSRDTDLAAFSNCDRTGAGVAIAGEGDAMAPGEEDVTQRTDAANVDTAPTANLRQRRCRAKPAFPATGIPPYGNRFLFVTPGDALLAPKARSQRSCLLRRKSMQWQPLVP
jgi:hypothetical protein